MHVRRVEGQVVVPPVPQHDIGFPLRLFEDGRVVDARVDDESLVDVRLVLLHLLDGALVALHVLQGGEALHLLLGEVAVRHGVADDHRFLPHALEDGRHVPRGLALAAARSHGADRHDGDAGLQHGVRGAQQPEIGAQRDGAGGLFHDVLVGHVGVGKDHLVDLLPRASSSSSDSAHDGDALRVQGSRQVGRIAAAGDVGDLRGGECRHAHRPGSSAEDGS